MARKAFVTTTSERDGIGSSGLQGGAQVQLGRTCNALQLTDSSADSRYDLESAEAAQTSVSLQHCSLGCAAGAGAVLETRMPGRQEPDSSAECNDWRQTARTGAQDPDTMVPANSNAEAEQNAAQHAAQDAQQPGGNGAVSSSVENTGQSADQMCYEAAQGSSQSSSDDVPEHCQQATRTSSTSCTAEAAQEAAQKCKHAALSSSRQQGSVDVRNCSQNSPDCQTGPNAS